MTHWTLMAAATRPSSGPSGVSIATLVIAAVGSLGAAGAALAAFFQARASNIAAGQAADAARDAARIASQAQKETALLTAELTQGGEGRRWQRDGLCAAVVDTIEASKAHTQALRDEDTVGRDAVHQAFDQLSLHATRLELFCTTTELLLELRVLLMDHVSLQEGIGAPTEWGDIFARENLLINAAKRELRLPEVAFPELPSAQSSPPEDANNA